MGLDGFLRDCLSGELEEDEEEESLLGVPDLFFGRRLFFLLSLDLEESGELEELELEDDDEELGLLFFFLGLGFDFDRSIEGGGEGDGDFLLLRDSLETCLGLEVWV